MANAIAEALTQRLRMSSLQRWFDRSGFQSNRARCSRRPLWMARESGPLEKLFDFFAVGG
jgi:hypothetical protein